jgi:hypothetical protein
MALSGLSAVRIFKVKSKAIFKGSKFIKHKKSENSEKLV